MAEQDEPPASILLSPRAWPLTVKLPLIVAALTFAVSVATTQLAVYLLTSEQSEALEEKARLYLGAAALAVEENLADSPTAVEDALSRLITVPAAVDVLQLTARWPDMQAPLASTKAGYEGALTGRRILTVTHAIPLQEGGMLELEGIFDTRQILEATDAAQARALELDVLFAIAGAGLGLWLTRLLLTPASRITSHLMRDDLIAAGEKIENLDPPSTEFGRLQRLVNRRIEDEQARSRALMELAEREKQTTLAKLAASLAHEVRNPLAGLLNAVSTLRRFGEDAKIRGETADLLERGLKSMERVTTAALSTYRPRELARHFRMQDMQDVALLTRPQAARREISLEIGGTFADLAADAEAMRQILINLTLNAIKATPKGGRVSLSVEERAELVAFSVSDTGGGMPEDVLRFLHGAREGELPASEWLGLWTVMRLMDDIGGRLGVDTRPGHGTTVTVTLSRRENSPS